MDFFCLSTRLERLSVTLCLLVVLGVVLLLDENCGRRIGSQLRLNTEAFSVTTLDNVFSDSSCMSPWLWVSFPTCSRDVEDDPIPGSGVRITLDCLNLKPNNLKAIDGQLEGAWSGGDWKSTLFLGKGGGSYITYFRSRASGGVASHFQCIHRGCICTGGIAFLCILSV